MANPNIASCSFPYARRKILNESLAETEESAQYRCMKTSGDAKTRFFNQLNRPFLADELFDAVPDTVYFVKDIAGCYVAVNRTLAARTGFTHKHQLIGCTAIEVFPGALGKKFFDQDQAVLRSGKPIHSALELHLYPGGGEGWCLTWKEVVRNSEGRIIGLAGLSRDLPPARSVQDNTPGLSKSLEHIRDNLEKPLRLAALARIAGLSVFQFDKRMRAMFGLSAGQYVTRSRIEFACVLLRQEGSRISQIAHECGYIDQAAFSRQFRSSVGMTPRQYTESCRQ